MAPQPTHVDTRLGGNALPGGGVLRDVEALLGREDVQPTAELGPASIDYEHRMASEKKDAAAKKKADEAQAAQVEREKMMVQQIQSSPWTQLSNALAQQYQQAAAPATALMSGAATPAATSGAMGEALASLGLGPNSSAAGWLTDQAKAAANFTAPVAAAMKAQGAQYAAEQGPISKAIAAYGQANALQDITAPESSWLNALASHVTSNLSYYGEIPTADIPALKQAPGVVSALEKAGGYAAGTAGSGLTPLSSLSVNDGQVNVAPVSASGTPGLTPPTSGGGTIPPSSPHA